jgi:flagellar capping protein FliD
MKKNRNCPGMIYNQPMPMPIMGINPIMQQPINTYPQTTYTNTYNNIEEQINNIDQRINSLENRISKLESKQMNTNQYTNKYNDSNYYML